MGAAVAATVGRKVALGFGDNADGVRETIATASVADGSGVITAAVTPGTYVRGNVAVTARGVFSGVNDRNPPQPVSSRDAINRRASRADMQLL